MKKLLTILFLLCFYISYSQPVVNRSGQANTVQDARLMAQYNLYVPRYIDTTSANLQKGIDSAGAVIYTYDVNNFWYRQSSPKKWVQFSTGATAINIYTSDGTITDLLRTVTLSTNTQLSITRGGFDQFIVKNDVTAILSPNSTRKVMVYNDSTLFKGLARNSVSTRVALTMDSVTGKVYWDTYGSGGGTPAGNYGNVQLNRNGAFATPASDSLTYNGGEFRINIADQGAYSLQMTGDMMIKDSYPTIRMDADPGTYGSLQMDDAAGNINLIYAESGLVYTVPGAAYSHRFIVNGITGLTISNTSGTSLTGSISTSTSQIASSFLGTAGSDVGAFHLERTFTGATGPAHHGFVDKTTFRYGASAFNSFGSFSRIGSSGSNQDHYASFQTTAYKDSSNTVTYIYGFVNAIGQITGGTVTNWYGYYHYDQDTAGGTITNQYGGYIPALTAATNNYGIISLTKSGFGTATPDSMLVTTSFKATAGVRFTTLPNFADTTDYKPVVVNTTTGTLYKATYWPGSGGAVADTFVIEIDKTYDSLAWAKHADTLLIKSARIRLNGVTSTPTVTDSTISWDLGVALTNIYTDDGSIGEARVVSISAGSSVRWDLADATSFFMIRTGSDTTLYGSGADFRLPSITSGAGTDSVLVYTPNTGRVHFRNASAFTTAPAGSDREIQWNNAGAFGASSNFKYNASGELLVGMADGGAYIGQFAGDIMMASSYPILYMNAAPGTYGSLRMEDAAGNINQLYADGGIVYSIPSSAYIHTFMVNSAIVAQFSNTGVPTAGFPGRVSVSGTQSEGASRGIVQIERTLSTLGANHRGYRDGTIFQQDAVAQYAYAAFDADVTMRVLATRTADHIASHQARGTKDSAGTLTTWYDFVAAVSTVSAGTVTTKYGLYIYPVDTTGTGVVTNQIGIYVPDLTQSTNKVGAIIVNGVMIGSTSSPTAKLDVLSTTEQTRILYDASNYFSTTIGSTGSATLNLVGTSPTFTFSDPVFITTISNSATAAVNVDGVQTLTNKRWIPRQDSTTSSATPTINTDNVDIYKLTAQAADITSFTTNLSGTPRHGEILEIQITGTAARAITWGSAFVASTVALPTTTSGTATLTVIFQYYTASSYGNNKWVMANSY